VLAVEVRNLTRYFGKFCAVNNISLTVKTGEIFGLIGPNGAGKTTTIRMLTGVLKPSSGSGTVGGHDILTEQEEIKKIIGYMSQRFSLYNDLTVLENLSFFGGIYGVSGRKLIERIDIVLKITDMVDKKRTIVKQLPQGFRQRLALGCAVLHRPKVVFLDEPTSGVDPEFRISFWNLIRNMKEEGLSVIVTTHYLDEAERADRIALVNKGKIVGTGTPTELVEGVDIFTYEVEVKNLRGILGKIRRMLKETVIIYGEKIHILTKKSIDEVKKEFRFNDIEYLSIRKVRPKLEDIFTFKVKAEK